VTKYRSRYDRQRRLLAASRILLKRIVNLSDRVRRGDGRDRSEEAEELYSASDRIEREMKS